jgi:hypothetical protein
MIQAAYDVGGLDGVWETVAGLIAPLSASPEFCARQNNSTPTRRHSPKRGREGFEVGGVLTEDRGNLITDFWGSYDTLEKCDHSRGNAHLFRELTSFSEDGHRWAEGNATCS